MGGIKPINAEKLHVEAQQLSHRARLEEKLSLPHVIETLRTKAIEAYKALGDHYGSAGNVKKANQMYKLMRKEEKSLKQFLRNSKPSTSGHVPSGN